MINKDKQHIDWGMVALCALILSTIPGAAWLANALSGGSLWWTVGGALLAPVGWVVFMALADRRMHGRRHLGRMRLGFVMSGLYFWAFVAAVGLAIGIVVGLLVWLADPGYWWLGIPAAIGASLACAYLMLSSIG